MSYRYLFIVHQLCGKCLKDEIESYIAKWKLNTVVLLPQSVPEISTNLPFIKDLKYSLTALQLYSNYNVKMSKEVNSK